MEKLLEKMTSSELQKACSEHLEFADSLIKTVKARHAEKAKVFNNQKNFESKYSPESVHYLADTSFKSISPTSKKPE